MRTVNALTLRNRLGEILEYLEKTGEPVLLSKGRKLRAALVPFDEFQKRFLDRQAEEERDRFRQRIESSAATRRGSRGQPGGVALPARVRPVRYVLDASVALKWLLRDEQDPRAGTVLRELLRTPERFAVPELFAYEVFSVLLRVHPRPLEAFTEVVLPLLQSGLLRYPMTEAVARRAHRFAQLGLTGYDACYAGLAEETDGVWLTFDSKAHACIARERRSVDLSRKLPADLAPSAGSTAG